MSPRARAKLTAEAVTFDDSASLALDVIADCGPCNSGTGISPNHVGETLRRRPIMDLFVAGRFKCSRCERPAARIKVSFRGNYVEDAREILNMTRT